MENKNGAARTPSWSILAEVCYGFEAMFVDTIAKIHHRYTVRHRVRENRRKLGSPQDHAN
jgi:hypothetical protein